MISRFSKCAVPSAVLLACLALAGCGGGGGSPTPSTIASIGGTVIDGYIEGASVCLDVNVNQTCDANEPSATTAKDGSYKLDTSSLTSDQIKAAHLLTVVPDTAKDSDDNGDTLAQAGKKGFSFMAPAEAYITADGSAMTGAVISPLTTLDSHDMIASGTVLATAKTNVASLLNVDPTNLTKDFVADKNNGLIQTAQMLTVAIGEVKATALADTTTGASDKDAFFAALEYLQNQVAELKKAFDAAKTDGANANAKTVDLVKAALKTDAAKPMVAALVAVAKQTTESTAASVVALIENGFYGASHALETALDGTSYTTYYSKILGSGGKISGFNDYKLENGSWVKDNDSEDWKLTSSGWKKSDVCGAGESITYNVASDGVTTVNDCSGTTMRLTARTVDASGKTLKALGLNTPADKENITMPAGSQLIWFKDVSTEEEFSLYTGYQISKWVWNSANQNGSNVPFTSLDSFIAANTQPNSSINSSYMMGWSGLYFSFALNDGLTLWNGFNNTTKIGEATYTRSKVHGVDLLIINAQAPENDPGERTFFAVKDGYVYGGSYTPAGTKNESSQFNKIMVNAILAAGNKPAVID